MAFRTNRLFGTSTIRVRRVVVEIVPLYPYRSDYPTECEIGDPFPDDDVKVVAIYGDVDGIMVRRHMADLWHQHDFGRRREGIEWALARGSIIEADLIAQRNVSIGWRKNMSMTEKVFGWFLLFEDHRDAIEYMLRYG